VVPLKELQIMHQTRLGSPIPAYFVLAVAVIAAIVPFARVLNDLYHIWNLQPEYSHGIIIPVISAFLIWRQRDELRGMPFTGSWSGVALIGAGLALRFIGGLTTMQTLEHYAFLLVVYGLVLALTGPAVFRRLWMPLLILLFAMPLPSIFGNPLSLQLQLISSTLGVWVIRAAGISVLLEGNIIDLGSYQLEVAEACNGLRYLFPLMTLAFIVAYLYRGPIWKRIVIFVSSIPIAVVMNSVRIGFIGVTVDHWGPKMAQGALHEFEGWLVFMLSTIALILTAFCLARVGRSRVKWSEAFNLYSASAGREAAPRSATHSLQPLPRSFVAAAALVLVGAAAGVAAPHPHVTPPPRETFDAFPTRIGDWAGRREALDGIYLNALRLDDYVLADYHGPQASPVNFYAAYYQMQDETRAVHSPRDCIPGGGWEIQKLETRDLPTASGATFRVNRALVQLGADKEVVYYWFQERGRHMTQEYVVRWFLFWDGLTRGRTDGALVRYVAPISRGGNEADADASILKLAALIQPTLNRYVPD
jgi:exosortase D (VPLPA-CTERM-specific)